MKTGNIEGKAEQDFFGNVQTPFKLSQQQSYCCRQRRGDTQSALPKRQVENCRKEINEMEEELKAKYTTTQRRAQCCFAQTYVYPQHIRRRYP